MSFQVEANAAGDYTLPALTATYTDPRVPDSTIDEVSTEPVSLTVTSVLENPQEADPTRFRDIKTAVAMAAPESGGPVWLWVGGVSAGLAALAAVGLVIARRRSGTATARQHALAALRDLELSGLLDDGQTDAYYTQLTSIVRRYIEDTFALRAVRQTTPEFLEQAKRDPALTDTDRRLLRECLTAADMVKFARFQPSLAAGDQAIATARTFIQAPRGQETGERSGRVMEWHHPSIWLLSLLLLLPLLAWHLFGRRRRAALRFSSTREARQLSHTWRTRLRWLPNALRLAAIALLIVGLARPREGRVQSITDTEGIAIQLLVDRSGSMRAMDFEVEGQPVDRLTAVKKSCRRVYHRQ